MESIREKNERLRYELIEFIDYLSPTGGQTLLNLQDKIVDYYKDTGSTNKQAAVDVYLFWLDDLKQRELLKIILLPEEKEQSSRGIFRIHVQQPQLRDYLDELYTYKQIKIEKLDYPTLFAAKRVVEELQDELLVTADRQVYIPTLPSDDSSLDPNASKLRSRALSFLKAYGAIEDYDYSAYQGQILVTLRRRIFDVFVYTITKHVQLVKKLDTMFQSSRNKTQQTTPSKPTNLDHIICKLDLIPPKVEFQEKSFELGVPSIELSILKQLDDNYPQPATHQDIVDHWGGTEVATTIPDGCKRLNQKFKKLTGFEDRAIINLNAELHFNSHFAEQFLEKKMNRNKSDSD